MKLKRSEQTEPVHNNTSVKLSCVRKLWSSDAIQRISLLALWLFLFMGAPQKTFASPIECLPMVRGFGPLAEIPYDEWKKLSRSEFGHLPILPAGSALLVRGTELNALVDMTCLHDPARGPKKLEWLRVLVSKTKPRPSSSPEMSHSWVLDEDWDFLKLQDAIEEEPCVSLVSPERRFYVSGISNDPFVRDQAHLENLNYDQAWREFELPVLVRPKIVVAVIDTGVDFTHPDLRFNRWINPKEIRGNGKDDDGNGYVDDVDGYNFASQSNVTGPEGDWPERKHGTHVAGLAAARLDNKLGGIGIHGAAKIMSVNVFGTTGYSRSSILENAIRYSADEKAEILNMSLGGREYSRTMRAALDYAIRKGSFIVTAAGNDGIELCENPSSFDFISPAAYGSFIDGMLVTGSVDTATGKYSFFSNFSPKLVEITAPGAFSSTGQQLLGLLSTTPDATYGYIAGTSMAAPILSGAAALTISWLKAYRYEYTPARVEKIIRESAKQEPALEPFVQGGRILNLSELANYLKKNFPPRFPSP